MIQEAIAALVANRPLTGRQAREVASEILAGDATSCQIASFITALRIRGENSEHIEAFVEILRERSHHIRHPKGVTAVLDTCGTGGDGSGTFNVSTAAAIIAAAAGVCVAKHGNRAMSSKCGSADVLAQLGVNINASLEVSQRCLDEVGLCFLFAAAYHPAMKHAVIPRREVGIRCIFNMIGPLSNPAGATHQVLGVYAPELTMVFAEVLRQLGTKKALIVHGSDGLDEITITGPTQITELAYGEIRSWSVTPQDFGLQPAGKDDFVVHSVEEAAERLLKVLRGEEGPCYDMAVVNAAAGLYITDKAPSLREACSLARETIASGKAMKKLQALVETSNAA